MKKRRGGRHTFAKHGRVSGWPGHTNSIRCVCCNSEVLGLGEDVAEVCELAARARKTRAELDVHRQTGARDDRADDPHKQGQPD